MAGQDRMTVEEVVRRVLRDEHADVIRESVKTIAREIMEAEVSELIGAELGERRPEDERRIATGIGRRWDTRAGEIELQIPKLRQSSYFPSFLQPRKRGAYATRRVPQEDPSAGLITSWCRVAGPSARPRSPPCHTTAAIDRPAKAPPAPPAPCQEPSWSRRHPR